MTLFDEMIKCSITVMRESLESAVTVEAVAARMGIDPSLVQPLFQSDAALSEAVGTYGMVQLADAITRATVGAPRNDPRAKIKAMGAAFVGWGLANPDLYRFLAIRFLRPGDNMSVIRRYETSFFTLVRKFLSEGGGATERKAVIARAFIVGLTDLALDDNLDLWANDGAVREAVIDEALSDMVDLLLPTAEARS